MAISLTIGERRQSFREHSITIGSAPDCDIVFNDEQGVFPHHAVLRLIRERWLIEVVDAPSIRVGDGQAVQLAWLTPGDPIYLTDSGLQVIFETISEPLPPPVPPVRQIEEATQNTGHDASLATPLPPPNHSQEQNLRSLDLPNSLEASVDSRPKASMFPPQQPRSSRQKSQFPLLAFIILNLCSLTFTAWLIDLLPYRTPIPYLRREAREPDLPAKLVGPVNPPKRLVLVGLRESKNDHTPKVIGPGWFWNPSTVVLARPLAYTLTGMKASASDPGAASICVIHTRIFEVDSVEYPDNLPSIAILRLRRPVSGLRPIQDVWYSQSRLDASRQLNENKKGFFSFSYLPLPRAENTTSPLMHSPWTFRPGGLQIGVEPIEVTSIGLKHYLTELPNSGKLEPGGLILNAHQKIVGMVLLDGEILWSAELEPAFGRNIE